MENRALRFYKHGIYLSAQLVLKQIGPFLRDNIECNPPSPLELRTYWNQCCLIANNYADKKSMFMKDFQENKWPIQSFCLCRVEGKENKTGLSKGSWQCWAIGQLPWPALAHLDSHKERQPHLSHSVGKSFHQSLSPLPSSTCSLLFQTYVL